MHNTKKRFIQIMRIELEDLHDDIEALKEHSAEVWHEHIISEFGYWGNLGVLKNELCGVGLFGQILDQIDPDDYETLEEMTEDLEKQLLASIHKYGMVPAIRLLIRRKIDKVSRYVQE